MNLRILLLSLLVLVATPLAARSNPIAFKIAGNGKANAPIITAPKASPRVKEAAAILANYLQRMSGAKFERITGDGAAGIAVGLASDFSAIPGIKPFDAKDPTQREDYILRSHANGIYLLGATDLAVEHAVWDLLHRLGYRQFFPGAHWEIVPSSPEISIAVDVREHPGYYARRIWYGTGMWDYNSKPYAEWCARNRATSGIELHTGHAYDGILHANQKEFAAHPEYLGLVNGKRTSTKFCISNPGLRKLVAENALRQFDKTPDADSISVDPSDGGGWCECPECAKLGSITDRALALANEVATAVTSKYPDKWVGMYAYNYHSPPPSIKAHPRVVISVATAFIKGGRSIEELIAGWSSKCQTIGIREYYSVNTWDRDQPAAARGGNIDYLKRTIPHFYEKGARFMSAESSDNWGPNGLGYYLAARMMWDAGEAKNIDVLTDDFLTRAFGPAKEPMRAFYRQLDASSPHVLMSDQLGRMFRAVGEGKKLAGSATDVQQRLDDLLLYCRYVDLFQRYSKAQGAARQAAFEALIGHAYRMRTTMLVHTKGLYRDLAARDKSVTIPDDAKWNIAEGKNPWKSSKPFAAEELAAFLAEGIERYPLTELNFTPVAFGDDLVPATRLKLPDVATPGSLGAARGKQIFYTHVETGPATLALRITGGLIAHYRDRGNVKINVYKLGGASLSGEKETLAAQDRSVPPDGNEHAVKVALREPGLYRIVIDDGMDRTRVMWDCRLPMTVKSTADEAMNKYYSDPWQLYFYVPKGTKTLGFFGGAAGEICDLSGKTLFSLKGRQPNYYSVAVPPGQDGKAWSIRGGRGSVRLLTVPPCFARTPAELLLPAEVVARDAP
jgi:hypothetical protein